MKIPLLLGADAIHGYCQYRGATTFPTQLAQAQAWNADLIREIGCATAKEMFYTGPNWTFSPVLCVARDLRWGRIVETYGKDYFLIGKFALAMINSLQNSDSTQIENVL